MSYETTVFNIEITTTDKHHKVVICGEDDEKKSEALALERIREADNSPLITIKIKKKVMRIEIDKDAHAFWCDDPNTGPAEPNATLTTQFEKLIPVNIKHLIKGQ